jgi:hypothetical protein
MYQNVICLKCGKLLPFVTKLPFSVDKVNDEGWNVIVDDTSGQILNVRSSEIASICSQDLTKNQNTEKETKKNGISRK